MAIRQQGPGKILVFLLTGAIWCSHSLSRLLGCLEMQVNPVPANALIYQFIILTLMLKNLKVLGNSLKRYEI